MELVFGLLIVACFIIGLVSSMNEAKNKKVKTPIAKVTVTVERQSAKPDKTVYNEAKETLKLYGFSVKEAKDLLDKAGPHDDADEWARAAMQQVKI